MEAIGVASYFHSGEEEHNEVERERQGMKSDFKISVHRNGGNLLSLDLRGDFDDASARELTGVLKKAGKGTNYIFVHTGDLTNVDPFGRSALEGHLKDMDAESLGSVTFTGEHAAEVAPNGSMVLRVL